MHGLLFFIYVYCGNLLKQFFHYTGAQVISHNFKIAIVQIIGILILRVYLSGKIHPLRLSKIILIIFTVLALSTPFILNHIHTPGQLLLLQALLIPFGLGDAPAVPIFFKHFPVFKRFTYISFLYALSRALVYVITSFGLVYVTKFFGHQGIILLMVPIIIGYAWGLAHFKKLEIKAGNYPLQ